MVSLKPLEEFSCRKILLLIPHADDELVGCFKLTRYPEVSVTGFYFGFVAQGLKGESESARLNEIQQSARALGLRLVLSGREPVEELRVLLCSEPWDLVCVPSFIDWHRDHLEVNAVLARALEAAGNHSGAVKVLAYQVSVPLPERYITHYSAMSKVEQNQKWSLFDRIYQTQRYLPVLRFVLNERIAGQSAGAYAAEIYAIFTVMEYQQCFIKWHFVDKGNLRMFLNNIITVREAVRNLLLKVEQDRK